MKFLCSLAGCTLRDCILRDGKRKYNIRKEMNILLYIINRVSHQTETV